ncbi:hypothetical protein JHK86_013231 [Glycine max]|nr:hypothetical protein JHK86_013231 [Glycine max]
MIKKFKHLINNSSHITNITSLIKSITYLSYFSFSLKVVHETFSFSNKLTRL